MSLRCKAGKKTTKNLIIFPPHTDTHQYFFLNTLFHIRFGKQALTDPDRLQEPNISAAMHWSATSSTWLKSGPSSRAVPHRLCSMT